MNYKIQSAVELGKSVIVAFAVITMGTITTSSAQNNIPNGLFSPTAAQRFFEVGRKEFERERDFLIDSEDYLILNDSEDDSETNLLQLDSEAIEQIKEINSVYERREDNS